MGKNFKRATKTAEQFLDYFTNTYFEGDFDVKSWNHFSTAGPRTYNNMEGYNAKLKKHVGVAHPNIYKAIQFFQTEEVAAHFKYLAANKGDKPLPRNKLVILFKICDASLRHQ